MIGIRPKKTRRTYKKTRKTTSDECVFCAVAGPGSSLEEQTEYFYVVKNKYPYLVWDGQRVTDHLLIVPREHYYLLDELHMHEFQEYMTLVAKYDKKGYNCYSRGKDSSARSIHHQHTHLIKTDNTALHFLLFFKRPYNFWYR